MPTGDHHPVLVAEFARIRVEVTGAPPEICDFAYRIVTTRFPTRTDAMDEERWLGCADLQDVLNFIAERSSERKLRLLACAAVRSIWHFLGDERSQAVAAAADRYADGEVLFGE